VRLEVHDPSKHPNPRRAPVQNVSKQKEPSARPKKTEVRPLLAKDTLGGHWRCGARSM